MADTDEITLLFTGGLDSTLAATQLARDYARVHLLTFNNGFCMGADRFPQKRVADLKRLFGQDRFTHELIDVGALFRRLRQDFGKHLRHYHSPLIFDLCCRLSMDTRTVIYNLEHGIPYVADGNSESQTEIFVQRKEYTAEVERFMREHGVEYIRPVYDFGDRDKRRQALQDMGFASGNKALTALQRLGLNNFSDQLGKQPICMAAWGAAVMTSPLRDWPVVRHFQLSVEDAIEFRHNREEIARACIREYFARKRINLDALLAKQGAATV